MMPASKYSVLSFLVIMIFAVGFFGGYFGWTTDGIPKGGNIGATPMFLWDMITFSIDGMPVFVSLIFDLFVIMTGYLALNWIRGND